MLEQKKSAKLNLVDRREKRREMMENEDWGREGGGGEEGKEIKKED